MKEKHPILDLLENLEKIDYKEVIKKIHPLVIDKSYRSEDRIYLHFLREGDKYSVVLGSEHYLQNKPELLAKKVYDFELPLNYLFDYNRQTAYLIVQGFMNDPIFEYWENEVGYYYNTDKLYQVLYKQCIELGLTEDIEVMFQNDFFIQVESTDLNNELNRIANTKIINPLNRITQ